MDNSQTGIWQRLDRVPLLLPCLSLLSGTLIGPSVRGLFDEILLLALLVFFAATVFLYLNHYHRCFWVVCLVGFLATGMSCSQKRYEWRQEELVRLGPLLETGVVPEWKGFHHTAETEPCGAECEDPNLITRLCWFR